MDLNKCVRCLAMSTFFFCFFFCICLFFSKKKIEGKYACVKSWISNVIDIRLLVLNLCVEGSVYSGRHLINNINLVGRWFCQKRRYLRDKINSRLGLAFSWNKVNKTRLWFLRVGPGFLTQRGLRERERERERDRQTDRQRQRQRKTKREFRTNLADWLRNLT